MSEALDTDLLLVNRNGTSYKQEIDTMRDRIDDTDLLLIYRNGQAYKITGEDFIDSTQTFVGPVITNAVLVEDSPGGTRFANQEFDITYNMATDGVPASSKLAKPYVIGGISLFGETSAITNVGGAVVTVSDTTNFDGDPYLMFDGDTSAANQAGVSILSPVDTINVSFTNPQTGTLYVYGGNGTYNTNTDNALTLTSGGSTSVTFTQYAATEHALGSVTNWNSFSVYSGTGSNGGCYVYKFMIDRGDGAGKVDLIFEDGIFPLTLTNDQQLGYFEVGDIVDSYWNQGEVWSDNYVCTSGAFHATKPTTLSFNGVIDSWSDAAEMTTPSVATFTQTGLTPNAAVVVYTSEYNGSSGGGGNAQSNDCYVEINGTKYVGASGANGGEQNERTGTVDATGNLTITNTTVVGSSSPGWNYVHIKGISVGGKILVDTGVPGAPGAEVTSISPSTPSMTVDGGTWAVGDTVTNTVERQEQVIISTDDITNVAQGGPYAFTFNGFTVAPGFPSTAPCLPLNEGERAASAGTWTTMPWGFGYTGADDNYNYGPAAGTVTVDVTPALTGTVQTYMYNFSAAVASISKTGLRHELVTSTGSTIEYDDFESILDYPGDTTQGYAYIKFNFTVPSGTTVDSIKCLTGTATSYRPIIFGASTGENAIYEGSYFNVLTFATDDQLDHFQAGWAIKQDAPVTPVTSAITSAVTTTYASDYSSEMGASGGTNIIRTFADSFDGTTGLGYNQRGGTVTWDASNFGINTQAGTKNLYIGGATSANIDVHWKQANGTYVNGGAFTEQNTNWSTAENALLYPTATLGLFYGVKFVVSGSSNDVRLDWFQVGEGSDAHILNDGVLIAQPETVVTFTDDTQLNNFQAGDEVIGSGVNTWTTTGTPAGNGNWSNAFNGTISGSGALGSGVYEVTFGTPLAAGHSFRCNVNTNQYPNSVKVNGNNAFTTCTVSGTTQPYTWTCPNIIQTMSVDGTVQVFAVQDTSGNPVDWVPHDVVSVTPASDQMVVDGGTWNNWDQSTNWASNGTVTGTVYPGYTWGAVFNGVLDSNLGVDSITTEYTTAFEFGTAVSGTKFGFNIAGNQGSIIVNFGETDQTTLTLLASGAYQTVELTSLSSLKNIQINSTQPTSGSDYAPYLIGIYADDALLVTPGVSGTSIGQTVTGPVIDGAGNVVSTDPSAKTMNITGLDLINDATIEGEPYNDSVNYAWDKLFDGTTPTANGTGVLGKYYATPPANAFPGWSQLWNSYKINFPLAIKGTTIKVYAGGTGYWGYNGIEWTGGGTNEWHTLPSGTQLESLSCGPSSYVQQVEVDGVVLTQETDPPRFAIGSEVETANEVPNPEAKMFCVTNALGSISDLSITDPGYTTMANTNTVQTLTFPGTFPSGVAADTELPVGTTLAVDVQATNLIGTVSATTNVVTPTT